MTLERNAVKAFVKGGDQNAPKGCSFNVNKEDVERMKEMAATGASSMKVFIEPAVIMFILVMNAAVGVKMGMGAEASLEALNSLNPSLTTLLRSSVPLPGSNARNIVPGDVILLKTGDKVPADCRILVINGGRLGADESALTGETGEALDKL